LRIAPTAIRERPRDGVRPIRVRLRPPWATAESIPHSKTWPNGCRTGRLQASDGQKKWTCIHPATAVNGVALHDPDGNVAPLYGFGWFLNPYRGHRRYAHEGETVGFRTAIQRYPDDHLTIVVLSNRAGADAPALADHVADLYFVKH